MNLPVPVPVATIVLLILSNVFMTFAWYGHLRYKALPLLAAIVISCKSLISDLQINIFTV